MTRIRQTIIILIVLLNISLISPSLSTTPQPEILNKIQATVNKSVVLNNIQFNYSSQIPTGLDGTLTYYILINFTVLFTNISSSTTITRAVSFDCFLSMYILCFDYENVTYFIAVNYGGPL